MENYSLRWRKNGDKPETLHDMNSILSPDCLSPLGFMTVLSMPLINTPNYCKSQWDTLYRKRNRKYNPHKNKGFLSNKKMTSKWTFCGS